MKSKAASLALSLITIISAPAQLSEDPKRKFDEAQDRIVRLSPTSFPELPGSIVSELQRRGCTIPQTPYARSRQNVVKGEFAKPGQSDWAVLCSVKGVSTILVFWNGAKEHPAGIASLEDRIFLQGIDDAFVEKASSVWYFYGGKWWKLTGAD